MNPQIMNAISSIEVLILSILDIIFCVLALFVLVYYIRRRYKLYKEINRIPQELLIMESYRNHLKNLRIMCIINNFIILILVIEFILNLGKIFEYFPYWIKYFVKDYNLRYLLEFLNYYSLFSIPIYYSLVPVLCMLMDFLWLAYRKYEYKYTMIRWTWYIVIRTLVASLVDFSINFTIDVDHQTTNRDLINTVYGILTIIDFIQYVYFARKFYLHLKSREKEIKLFYYDKKAYLNSKYIRIHFKIATILVGTAVFFFTLASSTAILSEICQIPDKHKVIPQQFYEILLTMKYYFGLFDSLSYFISQSLFILDYLYIFIVVVYKSYRDRQKLKNINNYIRPIMKQYHDSYYNRYTNYA